MWLTLNAIVVPLDTSGMKVACGRLREAIKKQPKVKLWSLSYLLGLTPPPLLWSDYVICFLHFFFYNWMVRYVLKLNLSNCGLNLSTTAQMTGGPTLTNESWKLGSGGSKKYDYIWYVEVGVNTKFVLGLPRANQIGLAH